MSTIAGNERLRRWYARSRSIRSTFERVVFGDGYGTALFLGALCFFMLYWRVGVLITDTNAIATTLVNVADGHLVLTKAPYGSGVEAPGTYLVGDRVYGRNYGIVFAALPLLWLVEGVATVADISIVLVALWSLLVIGWTTKLAGLLGRRSIVGAGSVVAGATFLGSLTVATPLGSLAHPVIALQLLTMIATALAGVFLYRLVSAVHDRRTGLFAGAAAMLATPLGFWAASPKRHSYTVLLLIAAGYALYRSRAASDEDTATTYRALAYVPVGLLAWVHAAEALLVFVALVLVDIPTARANDRRSLAVVGGAFFLSLVPFFLTNILISGNPIEPPRLLRPYGTSPGSGLASGGAAPSGGFFSNTLVGRIISQGIGILTAFGERLVNGFRVLATDENRVYHTFLRSGYIPEVAEKDADMAISLTVLESAPLLGAIIAIPAVVGRHLRAGGVDRLRSHLGTPVGTIDAFVVGNALLFTLLYMTRLPLHAQVTVRYLHPVFALGVYGIARLAITRSVLADHWRATLWTYAGTVLIGGQLVVAYLAITSPTLGEAVQFHALLSLGMATVLALWALAGSVSEAVPRVYGAVAFGLAGAAGTLFLLLSGLDYFDTAGKYMIPVVRAVAEAVTLAS